MIFTSSHIRLIKRFLFLLIPYSLLRIGFYFYHSNLYKDFSFGDILTSFLLGIRFDIAAICLLNIFIVLLSLIPTTNSKFFKFDRLLFVFLNMAGFIVAIDDYELFLFMGKRLSLDVFAIFDDILDQLPQVILYYWYLPLAAIALAVGLYFFDKRFFTLKNDNASKRSIYLGGFLILTMTFIGIRGGLQHKSINVQSAFIQGKNELGHLVLNTPYHFLRTLKSKRAEKLRYFKTDEEAKNIVLNSRNFGPGLALDRKFNIVILILESFSLEYVEEGYTPFLKELMGKSLFLDKHLANGRRSIEVLPSILCGLPSLINDPISKSAYSGNNFVCMPKLLKSAGYQNYFFHGGSRGTMGFESYTLSNGFDKYFSKEDYPGEDFDGTWGIFDEPFLKFSAKKISTMKEPFLAGIFTLSSHQPYAVPLKYKDKFKKGKLEIHESIGYTDYAVKKFFQQIQNEAWFKNTVFILTADHTQKHETKKFQNLVGQYRVPLVIYSPSIQFPAEDKVTQHSDIPYTILDIVGLKREGMPLIGSSVFSKDQGMAINYADGSTYVMVRGTTVNTLDKLGSSKTLNINWETGQLTEEADKPNLELMAHLQYFINGLINNNL